MTGTSCDNALTRWLTTERIGLSSFIEFVAFSNRQFWTSQPEADMAAWTLQALELFACGECHSLANAVALEAGFPVLILRRQADRGLDRIAHAAVCDPGNGVIADILGKRPASSLVEEMREAVGDLALELVQPADAADAEEHEFMATIGAGLPWLPRSRRRQPTIFPELYRAVSNYYARTHTCT